MIDTWCLSTSACRSHEDARSRLTWWKDSCTELLTSITVYAMSMEVDTESEKQASLRSCEKTCLRLFPELHALLAHRYYTHYLIL